MSAPMLGACAAGLSGPTGPVVSPTGFVYPLGTRPTETRFSQTATLYLRQGNLERALELALEGVDFDPGNPIHYYLAGSAYAQLGRANEADEVFDEAERIYPAYELDVEPERERAWALAFNEGIEAFDEGEIESAIAAWTRATGIFNGRPDAHRNLAVLLAGEGRYEEAVEVYNDALGGLEREPVTRVLDAAERQGRAEVVSAIEENLAQLLLFTRQFAGAEVLLREQLGADPDDPDLKADLAAALTGLGRHDEAAELYSELVSTEDVRSTELFNIGVALFRAGDFAEAGRAFERLIDLQPNSRDAWFNYANALFAGEEWEMLASAGDRLTELDPLGEDAGLIAARAHLESGDEEAARAGLERVESSPVYLKGLQLRAAGGGTQITGELIGSTAELGTPLRLRFSFYGESGLVGTETVAVFAPAPEVSEPFDLSFEGRATAYRYEVLP